MIRISTARLVFAAALLAPVIATAASGQNASAQGKPMVSLTIPKDAVDNGDGTWSYKDKQGKQWTYTKTPFGVSRVAANAAATAKMPAGVPKNAVRNADGTFTAADKDGKKWNYQNTPFGVSRTAATAAAAPEWKVTDKGDTVRFERQGGPMGPSVWEKKKTELNDEERAAWEAQKAASQNARPE
jgi:hypothetical protein